MFRSWVWALVAAVAALRFFHSGVLWVEEAYPMTGALEMLEGRVPYRDFWYDKPPLTPLFYLLCGAFPDWPLRLLGALFVIATAWCAHGFARDLWSEREARWAALLTALVLTFGFPATVMAIAPDLLLVLPHLAAVWLAWRGRAFASGLVAGVAMLANFKAVFVAMVCFALVPGAGFIAGFALPLLPLALLNGFFEQVWTWGRLYAAQPLRPWSEGVTRTLGMLGYWSALVAGAVVCLRAEARRRWWWLGWCALMLVSAWLGGRFFPRYYFALVPPMVLLAARGLAQKPWLAALLAIPLVRFGPGVLRPPAQDLALFEDARTASRQIGAAGSVFVWGYRPELSVLARASSGTPFIESQPLTGVFADRHLSSTQRAASEEFTVRQLAKLRQTQPEVIVDGLGPLNPALAIAAVPELREWLEGYQETGRTKTCIIYRSNKAAASPETR